MIFAEMYNLKQNTFSAINFKIKFKIKIKILNLKHFHNKTLCLKELSIQMNSIIKRLLESFQKINKINAHDKKELYKITIKTKTHGNQSKTI